MQRQYRPTPSPEFLAHFVPVMISDHEEPGFDLPDYDLLDSEPTAEDLAPYVAMAGEE